MSNFYGPDEIIIDPDYPNTKAYEAHFDYDLLGHPIGIGKEFLRNPAGFLRTTIMEYKLELLLSSGFLFVGLFVFLVLQDIFNRLKRLIGIMVYFYKAWKKTKAKMKKRVRRGLPIIHDEYAQIIYRSLTRYYQGPGSAPIPETDVEFEAVRFALESAMLTGPSLRVLLEANPFLNVENEPIEGQMEDDELERLLRKMMPPMPEEVESQPDKNPPFPKPKKQERRMSDGATELEEESSVGSWDDSEDVSTLNESDPVSAVDEVDDALYLEEVEQVPSIEEMECEDFYDEDGEEEKDEYDEEDIGDQPRYSMKDGHLPRRRNLL